MYLEGCQGFKVGKIFRVSKVLGLRSSSVREFVAFQRFRIVIKSFYRLEGLGGGFDAFKVK